MGNLGTTMPSPGVRAGPLLPPLLQQLESTTTFPLPGVSRGTRSSRECMEGALLSRGKRQRWEEAVVEGMEDPLGSVWAEWEAQQEPVVASRWVVGFPLAAAAEDPIGAAAGFRAAFLPLHRLRAVPRCAESRCRTG